MLLSQGFQFRGCLTGVFQVLRCWELISNQQIRNTMQEIDLENAKSSISTYTKEDAQHDILADKVVALSLSFDTHRAEKC